MKSATAAALAAALLAAAACAPVVEGGPPIALPIGLQETAQVGSITLSTGWLDAEEANLLRYAEELKLWRGFACGSMIEYMERAMGYAPHTAAAVTTGGDRPTGSRRAAASHCRECR